MNLLQKRAFGWSVLPGVGAILMATACGGLAGAQNAQPKGSAVVDRGVQITESVSSDSLAYDAPAITVTLTLVTGSTAHTAAIGVEPSSWPDPLTEGSVLRILGHHITGAGHQTSSYSPGGAASEVGVSVCVRGAPQYDGGIDLALPANSRTNVAWQVALSAPPWVSQTPAVRWIVAVPSQAHGLSQITDRQIGPETFHVRGRTGVKISLRAGAGTNAPAGHTGFPYRTIQAGQQGTILGTTIPHLSHTHIQLTYAATIGHHHGLIGTALTKPNGTFAIAWRPQTRGIDTITAAVSDPPARVLPDRNCDLALEVQ